MDFVQLVIPAKDGSFDRISDLDGLEHVSIVHRVFHRHGIHPAFHFVTIDGHALRRGVDRLHLTVKREALLGALSMQQRRQRAKRRSGCETSSGCAVLLHGINVSWSKRMRLALFALAAALSASAQSIAFSHATVIDGTGAAPLRDATIVVSSGRITAIGPAAK